MYNVNDSTNSVLGPLQGLGGYLAMLLWLAGYKLIPASDASIYTEAQGAFIVLFAWLFLPTAGLVGRPDDPLPALGDAVRLLLKAVGVR